MQSSLSALALLTIGTLAGCGTPPLAQALHDADGDGIGERVALLEDTRARQIVLLHLEKIEACRKMHTLAKGVRAQIQRLYETSRASADAVVASETRVAQTKVAVLDAQLALTRTGLLPASQPAMFDTDGDGLPDVRRPPVSESELLEEKLALRSTILEHCKVAQNHARMMHESGIGPESAIHEATQQLYQAELDWLDARMEQHAVAVDR